MTGPSALPAASPVAPTPLAAARDPWLSERARRYLYAAPDLVAVLVAGFALGPLVALLIGHFTPALVLPLGLATAAGSIALYRPAPDHRSGRELRLTCAAIALVALWALVNMFFSAQDVFATRDPATYNLTARWLMEHHNLLLPTQADIFGSPGGAESTSAGFGEGRTSGQLYAQGNHLLPALMAVGGWLFGVAGLLKTNVVISALAILVLYGLARRIVGAGWALVSLSAMLVCVPLLYVGRDAYTEPLAMLCLLGGAAMLMAARRSGRLGDYVLAGLVAGMAAAVRIDSYASSLALIAALVVFVGIAAAGERRAICLRALAFLASGGVVTLLGWRDLTQLSFGYYRDQRSHIILLFYAGGLALLLAPLVIALCWSPAGARLLAARRVRARVATLCSVAVVAVAAILLSRPLWLQTTGARNISLEAVQAAQGIGVDGTRLYNENSLSWLALYFGWPTLALAVAGYIVLIRRALLRPAPSLLPALLMGLTMSALYLWSSQITPDQPWAIRRYVPVVIPLLLIAATAALSALGARLGRGALVVARVGAAVVIGYPLVVAVPVLTIREEAPLLASVRSVCAAIGPQAAVLMANEGATGNLGQTMRSYCGVPSIGLNNPDAATLAQTAAAVQTSGRHLVVMATDLAGFAATEADPAVLSPFSSTSMQRWPSVINALPSKPRVVEVNIYLASVDSAGHLVPLA